jgi:DNA primase
MVACDEGKGLRGVSGLPMVGLPGDDVAEVRNRIPLEDLIRDYNVQLIPTGKRLRALCPFHNEKTPSFYVDVEKQFFHCFGCDEGGDIFTFVEKMDHVNFPEALEILARRAGVALRRNREPGAEKLSLFDALAVAENYYHRLLMEDPRGEDARRYLESRRINRDMWSRFRLGWSLPDWDGLIRQCVSPPQPPRGGGVSPSQPPRGGGPSGAGAGRKITVDLLVRAGLARSRENGSGHYDYFRGRVMFPICDPQKRVVGFGARALDDSTPKYLNTPKTALFEKGQLLYGLPQARAAIHRLGRIAIMEGYTDAIMAHQEGLDHAVANLGTAFTAENARGLRRLTQRVDLVFDGDAAGQSATERTLELLVAEDLEVRIFTVTTGKDPCDALVELGGEEFRRLLESSAVDVFEFKWRRTVESARARGEGPAGVARALDEVVALLAKVPNVVTRKLEARRLAERLGLDEADIGARLARQAPVAGVGRPAAVARGDGGGTPEGGARKGPSLEEVVLECILAEPERAAERLEELESLGDSEEIEKGAGGFQDLYPKESGLFTLAVHVKRQIAGGGLDLKSLADLQDDGARRALMRILARVFPPGSRVNARVEGQRFGADDIWKNCLRELERRSLERRSEALEEAKAKARAGKDQAAYLALQRQQLEILRRLKSPLKKDGDRIRPGSKDSGENPRKGSFGDQEARG